MNMNAESRIYRNWFVSAIPSERGWKFRCRAPSGKICSYEKAYRYPEVAMVAAREFVDRDITKVLLAQVLNEWVQAGKIQTEEYQKIQASIYRGTHPATHWAN